MSSLTDRNLTLATRALVERDDRLADAAEAEDAEIDQLEVEVDEKVVTYMSTHGPIARDSRLMLAASKISANLERIADEATTIARRARLLNAASPLLETGEIPKMAALAQSLLHDALTAFVEGRYELARDIIPRDKEIDALYHQVSAKLVELMKQDPAHVERAVSLLTIAKALERAGDHAQNIAEEVFYLFKGEDIRHGLGTGTA